MNRFILSREYGELVEGYRITQAELARLVTVQNPTCLHEERTGMLLEERAEWAAAMGRCPMFVGGAR